MQSVYTVEWGLNIIQLYLEFKKQNKAITSLFHHLQYQKYACTKNQSSPLLEIGYVLQLGNERSMATV